ncbi:interferon omega-1-like [Myiozetetes cayanensis]|uniref:interferon omega-1-like n=1 Tax=Myiozetetes cayanensis TaxID=478635 RepID=UPI00215EFE8D|nr:interferon omega-1-like [Myiozetetes cayanensis]
MGGYLSQQCLNETTDFRFPTEITKITQNSRVIIYEFLQHIFQLFSKNLPIDAWNTSKIEKFQNGIHHQIEELETCLSEEQSKVRNNFQTWILKSSTYSIKKYFQRITSFLQDKQYSHCSWEAVQMELILLFSSSRNLQGTIHPNEDARQNHAKLKVFFCEQEHHGKQGQSSLWMVSLTSAGIILQKVRGRELPTVKVWRR